MKKYINIKIACLGLAVIALFLLAGVTKVQADDNEDNGDRRVSPYDFLPTKEVPTPREIDGQTQLRLRLLHDDDDMDDRMDNQEDHMEEAEMHRERASTTKDSLLEELRDRARERAEAYFERMVRRIEAAFERMGDLIERTESRINKLEENGLSTEESLVFVEEAKTKLAEGETAFEDAVELMRNSVFDSETPREFFSTVKESVRNAIESLKDSREALRNAVRVLKAEASNHSEDSEDKSSDDSSENNQSE